MATTTTRNTPKVIKKICMLPPLIF